MPLGYESAGLKQMIWRFLETFGLSDNPKSNNLLYLWLLGQHAEMEKSIEFNSLIWAK